MRGSSAHDDTERLLERARQIEEICTHFEAAWQHAASSLPQLEDYLPARTPSAHETLLVELLRLEVFYRCRAGQAPQVSEYQERFPSLDLTWLEQALREATLPGTPEVGPSSLPPGSANPNLPALEGLHVLGWLGSGGMGAVFRGHDPVLDRDVAIKVLLDRHRDDAELERRFLEEARLTGRLQHPGIVPVYQLVAAPGQRSYFTMKLVEGQTLAALLRERIQPQQELARFLKIFEQICRTLAYAHAQGVLHRDLKPANIMVGARGEVHVMDWGLAKLLREPDPELPPQSPPRLAPAAPASATLAPTRTATGVVMGTPAYMAPEQARGEIEQLDERCDVFGLGALLCEILTGQPPYPGDTRTAVRQQAARGDLAEAVARLDCCGAEPELVQLAKQCLAAQRQERPRDAGEVARTVTAYLVGMTERLRTTAPKPGSVSPLASASAGVVPR